MNYYFMNYILKKELLVFLELLTKIDSEMKKEKKIITTKPCHIGLAPLYLATEQGRHRPPCHP